MSQLLINNDTTVEGANATYTAPSDVPEGRVAAFNADDFSIGSLALDEATDAENVVFVQGAANGESPIITPIIEVDAIRDKHVHFKEYVAPTPQVTEITIDVTDIEGSALIRAIKLSDGYRPYVKVQAVVKVVGKTNAQVAEAFVDQLNSQAPNFLTASSSGAVLTLTGDIGVSFDTSIESTKEGEFIDWDRNVTAPDFGTGTSDQLKELENLSYGSNFYNRIYIPLTPHSYVVAGAEYDLFHLRHRTNTTANIAKGHKYLEITIAVQTEASGIDLNAFFGLTAEEDEDDTGGGGGG